MEQLFSKRNIKKLYSKYEEELEELIKLLSNTTILCHVMKNEHTLQPISNNVLYYINGYVLKNLIPERAIIILYLIIIRPCSIIS